VLPVKGVNTGINAPTPWLYERRLSRDRADADEESQWRRPSSCSTRAWPPLAVLQAGAAGLRRLLVNGLVLARRRWGHWLLCPAWELRPRVAGDGVLELPHAGPEGTADLR
jgi:hypothetical protein